MVRYWVPRARVGHPSPLLMQRGRPVRVQHHALTMLLWLFTKEYPHHRGERVTNLLVEQVLTPSEYGETITSK